MTGPLESIPGATDQQASSSVRNTSSSTTEKQVTAAAQQSIASQGKPQPGVWGRFTNQVRKFFRGAVKIGVGLGTRVGTFQICLGCDSPVVVQQKKIQEIEAKHNGTGQLTSALQNMIHTVITSIQKAWAQNPSMKAGAVEGVLNTPEIKQYIETLVLTIFSNIHDYLGTITSADLGTFISKTLQGLATTIEACQQTNSQAVHVAAQSNSASIAQELTQACLAIVLPEKEKSFPNPPGMLGGLIGLCKSQVYNKVAQTLQSIIKSFLEKLTGQNTQDLILVALLSELHEDLNTGLVKPGPETVKKILLYTLGDAALSETSHEIDSSKKKQLSEDCTKNLSSIVDHLITFPGLLSPLIASKIKGFLPKLSESVVNLLGSLDLQKILSNACIAVDQYQVLAPQEQHPLQEQTSSLQQEIERLTSEDAFKKIETKLMETKTEADKKKYSKLHTSWFGVVDWIRICIKFFVCDLANYIIRSMLQANLRKLRDVRSIQEKLNKAMRQNHVQLELLSPFTALIQRLDK